LTTQAQIVELLWELTDDSEDLFPNPSQLLDHAPGFYFMWK